ncbi:MAG: hypothetical protein KC468_23475, partial [Myxococcales bacterium]|nr:hypothetical protein [Myxococcales bacterium]
MACAGLGLPTRAIAGSEPLVVCAPPRTPSSSACQDRDWLKLYEAGTQLDKPGHFPEAYTCLYRASEITPADIPAQQEVTLLIILASVTIKLPNDHNKHHYALQTIRTIEAFIEQHPESKDTLKKHLKDLREVKKSPSVTDSLEDAENGPRPADTRRHYIEAYRRASTSSSECRGIILLRLAGI